MMKSTTLGMSDDKNGVNSIMFLPQTRITTPIQSYDLTPQPDGGVRSSVSDLAKFCAALLEDGSYHGARILDGKSAAEMKRFQFTDANRPRNFPATEGNSGLFWRTKFNGT